MDAVIEGVAVAERDPGVRNVGFGGHPSAEDVVQAVTDGRDLGYGDGRRSGENSDTRRSSATRHGRDRTRSARRGWRPAFRAQSGIHRTGGAHIRNSSRVESEVATATSCP
jgi:hypothetical protein